MASSVVEYKKLCQKNSEENYFFDKYIFRKISIYFTIIFIKLRITPNQASFLSLLAALGSCYFLVFNSTSKMLTAALLIFIYYMLDHVDGELARYYANRGIKKLSLDGLYFDKLIHKYSANIMLFFLGVSVYNLYGYRFTVLLGFMACIGMSGFPNLMASQVIVQKIAKDPKALNSEEVSAILYLLEKKQEQIKTIKDTKVLVKAKKLLSEVLFFPGSLLLIMLVLILDLLLEIPVIATGKLNFRLLYLILITPISLTNALRQALKWMRKYEKI